MAPSRSPLEPRAARSSPLFPDGSAESLFSDRFVEPLKPERRVCLRRISLADSGRLPICIVFAGDDRGGCVRDVRVGSDGDDDRRQTEFAYGLPLFCHGG